MTTWYKCKFYWYKKYVLKEKFAFEDNVYSLFGNVVHRLVQDFLTDVFNKSALEANRRDFDEEAMTALGKEYKKIKVRNGGKNVFTKMELMTIYKDASSIFKWFVHNRKKYFSKNEYDLAGIEHELYEDINEHIKFKGFIDILLKKKGSDEYLIIDLKTSQRGWTPKNKKDPMKRSQLIFYKKFLSDQLGIPLENITVKFLILKNHINENMTEGGYVNTSRATQVNIPESNRTVNKYLNEYLYPFIEETVDEDGKYKDDAELYPIAKYATSCQYCPMYWKNSKYIEHNCCKKWTKKYNPDLPSLNPVEKKEE